MKIVSSEQMAAIERNAMEQLGIPSILLMEHAALKVAAHCESYAHAIENPNVVVVAGPGNNGGDGLAVARILYLSGLPTTILLTADVHQMKGDPKTNYIMATQMGIPIVSINAARTYGGITEILKSCNIVVDGIFGVGLKHRLTNEYIDLIERINQSPAYVFSIDIPSGVHPDTGAVLGAAVKADKTVSFMMPKTGAVIYPGADYTGELVVESIGIPEEVTERFSVSQTLLTDPMAKCMLPKRMSRANKGTFGKIMVLAGSDNMPGSALLAASGAYRTGAGLVKICSTGHVVELGQAYLPEAVFSILPDAQGIISKEAFDLAYQELCGSDVGLVGPGLGNNENVAELVFRVLETARIPLVIDADGLNVLRKDLSILKKLDKLSVITPHPGEMSRLTGLDIQDILDNIIAVARRFAQENHVVTVLKDAHTIIADPEGRIIINTTGTPAMAKAGSGDVLSGIIAALMAQGLPAFEAAALGAYLHGKAGEQAEKGLTSYGVLARELVNHLPQTMGDILSV